MTAGYPLIRGRRRHALTSIALIGLSPVLAAAQPSDWGGGAGGWFNLNDISNGCQNWSTCQLNGTGTPGEGGDTYNVVIGVPGSAVTLNGGAVIRSLTIGAGTSLNALTNTYLSFDTTCGACSLQNSGTLTLNGDAYISINSPTLVISGTDTVTLAGADATIAGASGIGAELINQETLQGQGRIGLGGTQILNQGTINANASGGTLFVQTNGSGLTNPGTLEASNGGTLSIIQSGGVPLNNAGGTIAALNGSTVVNAAGVISGGLLTTSGTGVIESGFNPTLTNLTNAGTYVIPLNTLTTLEGTVTNIGTIAIGSSAGNGTLDIDGKVTLSGGGTVTLVDSGIADSGIHSLAAGAQLTNQNTIQGAGVIGDSGLTVVNQGSIIANAHDPLAFTDVGFTNTSLVEATNGATLNIFSTGFSNQGTLAVGPGATISFNGDYKLLNYDGTTNTLTGGTYSVAGTLQFTNAANGLVAINTNAANIVLNGAGSQILNALNGDALAGLAANAAGASLTIENGRNFNTAGAFLNSGAVTVGNGSTFNTTAGLYTQDGAGSLTNIQSGGTWLAGPTQVIGGGTVTVNGRLDPPSLSMCAGCTLNGAGTVVANVTSAGSVSPGASASAPGTLTITGNYTQTSTGTLVIDLAGVGAGKYGALDVNGAAALDGTVDFVATNGFVPGSGNDFTFLLFGSKSGSFSDVVFTDWTCPSGDTCSEVLGTNTLSLQISGQGGGGNRVPEPSSGLLTLMGLAALLIGRRHRAALA